MFNLPYNTPSPFRDSLEDDWEQGNDTPSYFSDFLEDDEDIYEDPIWIPIGDPARQSYTPPLEPKEAVMDTHTSSEPKEVSIETYTSPPELKKVWELQKDLRMFQPRKKLKASSNLPSENSDILSVPLENTKLPTTTASLLELINYTEPVKVKNLLRGRRGSYTTTLTPNISLNNTVESNFTKGSISKQSAATSSSLFALIGVIFPVIFILGVIAYFSNFKKKVPQKLSNSLPMQALKNRHDKKPSKSYFYRYKDLKALDGNLIDINGLNTALIDLEQSSNQQIAPSEDCPNLTVDNIKLSKPLEEEQPLINRYKNT